MSRGNYAKAVFVTGATGTLGRRVVSRLVADGVATRALARSAGNAELLRALGAVPVPGDLFDPALLEPALSGCDAVLHLATRIPAGRDAMRPEAWEDNDRIRTTGTRLLLQAAVSRSVETFLYPSVCLVYPDCGADWIDEDVPIPPAAGILASTVEAEHQVRQFGDQGRRAVVLRMGSFYGADTPHTLEAIALARRGIAALVGPPGGYLSLLDVDDAAEAVIKAIEHAPTGTYNVADDEPLTRRALAQTIAAAVGRRRLLIPPRWLARTIAGPDALALTRSQRVSARRFRGATGWAPSVGNGREGWARIGAALRAA